jgi:peptidoglycan hydrolase-like protein with peptidoglycan-binding domain
MSDILKVNSSGPDVAALQQALATANFNPGTVDGVFGLGTEAAVLAFQRSKGLAADGAVWSAHRNLVGSCRRTNGALGRPRSNRAGEKIAVVFVASTPPSGFVVIGEKSCAPESSALSLR